MRKTHHVLILDRINPIDILCKACVIVALDQVLTWKYTKAGFCARTALRKTMQKTKSIPSQIPVNEIGNFLPLCS
jgi:hypothetical protein